MPFTLPDLPYGRGDLSPHISERTMEFHHGKHHQAYINKANELVGGTENEGKSLEQLITKARADGGGALFNQAGQIWNHTFFWNSMTPSGGSQASGALGEAIDAAFGGFDAFAAKFLASAVGNFGSGWTWLVRQADGTLGVVNTAGAETPLGTGAVPLLTIDVWEHAYYLDYQNRRPDFVKCFLDHLANWDFAAQNFAA